MKKEVKLTGTVVSKSFGAGSKSAHEALHLLTNKGSFVLQRKDGNPYYDEALQKLKGKTVTAVGTIHDYLFMASNVTEKD